MNVQIFDRYPVMLTHNMFRPAGTGDMTVLRQVDVELISSETCNQRNWYNNMVTDIMFCAGHEDGKKDSCMVTENPTLSTRHTE